ncbi:MAG: magnesium transporter, partial [Deltaproteobacteria bacterium]|nr:magnesium transporter [Deltaproteobacteria bacterium]
MDQKLQILLDTTKKLIRRGASPNLTKVVEKTHPADIAALFNYLDPKEQGALFGLIRKAETAAYVLSEIDHST